MARMHSRDKGRSGSTKPNKEVPSWVKYKPTEVEKLIIKYRKAGKSSSEIGIILRDMYGINSVKAITGKKLNQIIIEKELAGELPEDLLNLIKRMVEIKAHLEKNNKDQTAKRGLILTSSKIRRLIKYYQRTGRLAPDWKLDYNRLKMYLE
jgi:small subunit ribosomal protein S15